MARKEEKDANGWTQSEDDDDDDALRAREVRCSAVSKLFGEWASA